MRITLLLAGILFSSVVLGCNCIGESFGKSLSESKAVALVRVCDAKLVSEFEETLYFELGPDGATPPEVKTTKRHFVRARGRTTAVLQGQVADTIWFTGDQDSSSCHRPIVVGALYLTLLGDDDSLHFTACSQTRRVRYNPDFVQEYLAPIDPTLTVLKLYDQEQGCEQVVETD